MEPEVVLVLGTLGIITLAILGLAVIVIGGKMRVTRKELEVSSEPHPKN